LNYWFVRAWGERARAHFRQRHLEIKQQAQNSPPILQAQTPAALGTQDPSIR
jgi:hypothetical protein